MPLDRVYTNARILTMDPAQPEAGELRLAGGRISAVGAAGTLDRAGAQVTDLGGRTVVPGFNDCHMHILPYGLDLAQADLSPTSEAGVADVPGLVAALRLWCAENPGSEWALGNRYDQNTFPAAAHPTRRDLDAAFPDVPVFIEQTSGHAGAANSVALKLAGITRDTPNPDGGTIVRDARGEPTGVLLESAVHLVTDQIPKPDRAGLVAAIRRANDALVRAGITSASDLNTGWLDIETEVACYQQAAREGAPVRTTLYPHAPEFGPPPSLPNRSDFARLFNGQPPTPGGVRLGPVKLFSDGALTVRTAALREPFVDGSGVGMLLHEPEELRAYIVTAHMRGWQVATHAIGDRAIELVLDCYAAAQEAQPRPGARHRVEHAMLLDDALIHRFVAQDVVPVLQPEFISRLGDAYVLGLGRERAARLNPAASLQRAGLGVPFSSDCPVVPGAPLDGVRAACRRVTPSGAVLGPDERVSAMDALRNYTYWAAYSTFDEAETGSITPGKRADVAVLDGDFRDEELDSLRVAATIVAGEAVYGAEILQ